MYVTSIRSEYCDSFELYWSSVLKKICRKFESWLGLYYNNTKVSGNKITTLSHRVYNVDWFLKIENVFHRYFFLPLIYSVKSLQSEMIHGLFFFKKEYLKRFCQITVYNGSF